jgi:hypothetical protein
VTFYRDDATTRRRDVIFVASWRRRVVAVVSRDFRREA